MIFVLLYSYIFSTQAKGSLKQNSGGKYLDPKEWECGVEKTSQWGNL